MLFFQTSIVPSISLGDGMLGEPTLRQASAHVLSKPGVTATRI